MVAASGVLFSSMSVRSEVSLMLLQQQPLSLSLRRRHLRHLHCYEEADPLLHINNNNNNTVVAVVIKIERMVR